MDYELWIKVVSITLALGFMLYVHRINRRYRRECKNYEEWIGRRRAAARDPKTDVTIRKTER